MSDWKQPWECSRCGALSMHWLDESEEACECLNCDRDDAEIDRIAELKAEIERLQAENKEHIDAYQNVFWENERLRAALKRIESNVGFSKTFLQKIAREALKEPEKETRRGIHQQP